MRILIGFVVLICISCTGTKDLGTCDEKVQVQDHSSLDGCTFLLITESGKKLLPSNGELYELKDQSWASISYRTEDDAMSICMSEDMIVKLTCFTPLDDSEVPRKVPCLATEDPNTSGWLKDVMDDWQPIQVERYNYLDGYAYLCKRPEMTKLYDCQGTLLCTTSTEDDGCAERMSSLTNKMTIWVAHR